ncbi:MAG: class I SAM-dependent methyltransferase [Candidatus Thorarchaeota archaeon]
MTQNEHKPLIVELARLFKPKVYVELGIAAGYVFNAVVPYVQSYAFGCDINLKKYIDLKKEDAWIKKQISIQVIEKSTQEAAKLWPEDLTIDLLYIDANHAYNSLKQDFLTWSEFVTPGTGLILLHDTYPINKKYLKPGYCNDAWKVGHSLHEKFIEPSFWFHNYECVTLPGPHCGLSIIRKRGKNHLHWTEQS